MSLTKVTNSMIQGAKVNVLDFGVSNTGVDSTANIQAAYGSLPSGGTVYWPAGTYRWSTAITVPQLVSTEGCGYGTQMYPTGCDGFTYSSSDGIGAVYVRDFYLYGSGSAFTGIKLGDSITDINKRVTGLFLSNIVIDNFAVGIRAKGLWHSTLQALSINRCPGALQIVGRSVSNSIISCHIQKGAAPALDTSVGVYIDGFTYATGGYGRPEAIRILDETLVYGFNTNVYVVACTSFSCVDSDLDYAVSYGLRAVIVNDGLTIRGNWFAGSSVGGSVPVLIFLEGVATPDFFPSSIDGNNFVMVGATAGSTAIKINANRKGIQNITGNYVENTVDYGVYGNYSVPGTLQINKNTIDAPGVSLFLSGTSGCNIANNLIHGPIVRTTATGPDFFINNGGTQTTCYHGLVTISAGNTTQTISLASLGLSNPVIAAPATLVIRVNAYQSQGTASRGIVRAYYDGAGNIVIIVTNAFGSNSNDVWVDMEST